MQRLIYFLRLMDGYAPTITKLICLPDITNSYSSPRAAKTSRRSHLLQAALWYLRKVLALLALCAGFMCAEARAQAERSEVPAPVGSPAQRSAAPMGDMDGGADAHVKPLRLGESIPLQAMEQPFLQFDAESGQTSEVRLSDFKGKLLIIDFWASWCTSCIIQFPKLHALQSQFADDVKILLVNSTQDDMPKMKKRLESLTDIPRQTLMGQPILHQLFPYRFLPHYVWIGFDGKLLQTTSHLMVTETNIQTIIDHEKQKAVRRQAIQSKH